MPTQGTAIKGAGQGGVTVSLGTEGDIHSLLRSVEPLDLEDTKFDREHKDGTPYSPWRKFGTINDLFFSAQRRQSRRPSASREVEADSTCTPWNTGPENRTAEGSVFVRSPFPYR